MSFGGSTPATHVAAYYMSIHYGICTGPVDSFNKMVIDDKIVPWGGFQVEANFTLNVNAPDLFGGNTKQGGVVGNIDVMLGGESQVLTPQAAERLGGTPETLPGFRGIVSLFFRNYDAQIAAGGFRGFYWTANNPYLQPPSFEMSRYPVGPNGKVPMLGTQDILVGPTYSQANGADIIWECLTDTDWGMGSPEGILDRESFNVAAQTLIDEALSLSMIWTRQNVVESFINDVIDHIQATLFASPRTGLLTLKLLRDDYDRNSLPIINPDNAKITKFQRKVWGETANEVIVSWTNPATEESETVVVHNNANIGIQGSVVSISKNYYGFRDSYLAIRVALRDLEQVSTPFLAIDVECNRTFWTLVPGDMCEVQYPEHGIGRCFMRVATVDYGKPGASVIKASMVEDIFSFGTSIFVPIGENLPPTIPTPPTIPLPPPPPPPIAPWVDPALPPPGPIDHYLIRDVPYFLLTRELGDVAAAAIVYPSCGEMVLASQDVLNVFTIGLWTELVGPVGELFYSQVRFLNNTKRGVLATGLPLEETSTVSLLSNFGIPIAVGTIVEFISATNPDIFEMTAVISNNGNGTYTLQRGVLDTVPLVWSVGDLWWNYPATAASVDPTGRVDGGTARYKFTPKNNLGMYPVTSAAVVSKVCADRMFLPYRPANVKIDGDLWSVPLWGGANVVVTWARRNRLLESSQIFGWTEADVTPEAGQTTIIRVFDNAGTLKHSYSATGTSYTIPFADISDSTGAGAIVSIRIKSNRDGYDSFREVVRSLRTTSGYGKNYGNDYGGT